MPTWEPPWDDVAFDFDAAARATSRLHLAARFLDDRHVAIGPALVEARSEWRGPARVHFDRAWEQHERLAWLLADELRCTATLIEVAADEARAEQARREAARRLWTEEVAAEARAAAERAWAAPTPFGSPALRAFGGAG